MTAEHAARTSRSAAQEEAIAYEKARELARDPDPAVRRALAGRPDVQPEILYFLAEDADAEVRRAVADNERAPRQADLILTKDGEDAIRGLLAQKVARLTPELGDDERSTLYQLTVQALEVLAEDQLVQVRRILAETLKDVAKAPPSVIRMLAYDRELSVAQPVLEFSPVLSDRDLLEIIRSGPIQGALSAISRRRGLGGSLSDAIVGTGDAAAITALLANQSAQIREETLDLVLDRAPGVEQWHEPLVMRPKLSAKAARRIASFVAMHLLDKLQRRIDLDDDTLVAVTEAVERRIEAETKKIDDPDWAEQDDIAERIEQLAKTGKLDGPAIERGLAKGERRFVMAALARLAGVSTEVVGEIVGRRVAKAIVAIAYKAGLRPHLAKQLQSQLAGIPPAGMVRMEGDRWPLSTADMEWQLEFFTNPKDRGDDGAG